MEVNNTLLERSGGLPLVFAASLGIALGTGCVAAADPDDDQADASADTRGGESTETTSVDGSATSSEDTSGGTTPDDMTDSGQTTGQVGDDGPCVEPGGVGACCSNISVDGVCCVGFGDACQAGQCCFGECDDVTGMCPEAPSCGGLDESCIEQECCGDLGCSDVDVCALTCAEPGEPCLDQQCCAGLTCDAESSTCAATAACAFDHEYCGDKVMCCDLSYCVEELAHCERQPG